MTKYLISFPSEAIVLTNEQLAAADIDSHTVIEEAKAAGVDVFGGGIDEQVVPRARRRRWRGVRAGLSWQPPQRRRGKMR